MYTMMLSVRGMKEESSRKTDQVEYMCSKTLSMNTNVVSPILADKFKCLITTC